MPQQSRAHHHPNISKTGSLQGGPPITATSLPVKARYRRYRWLGPTCLLLPILGKFGLTPARMALRTGLDLLLNSVCLHSLLAHRRLLSLDIHPVSTLSAVVLLDHTRSIEMQELENSTFATSTFRSVPFFPGFCLPQHMSCS